MIIKIFHNEIQKTLTIDIDENINVSTLIKQLGNKEEINLSKLYYLKTIEGRFCPFVSTFKEIGKKDFVLVQDAPPPQKVFNQLGIFLLDGSGSMTQGSTKDGLSPSVAVEKAFNGVVNIIKSSRKRECYSFSVIAFGDVAITISEPINVTEIDTKKSYLPTSYFNSGSGSNSTNIAVGLQKAYDFVKDFLDNREGKIIHRVEIVILSDGMCHDPDASKEIAQKLKSIPEVHISSCHLETGANDVEAVKLLKDISNDYKTVYDENTIKTFFISSSTRLEG